MISSGADLKAWRAANRWTQSDLMRELDVTSRQTIAAWEKAERLPRLVQLAIIAVDQVEPCRRRAGFAKQLTPSSIANIHFSPLKAAIAASGDQTDIGGAPVDA